MLADDPPLAAVHCIITGQAIETAEPVVEAAPATTKREPAIHRRRTPRKIGGALATILAAAFIATTAWGMWAAKGALNQQVPALESELPVIVVPTPELAPTPVVAPRAAETEAKEQPPAPARFLAPPKATPKPNAGTEPELPPPPRYVQQPRCDCYNDGTVCGCLE